MNSSKRRSDRYITSKKEWVAQTIWMFVFFFAGLLVFQNVGIREEKSIAENILFASSMALGTLLALTSPRRYSFLALLVAGVGYTLIFVLGVSDGDSGVVWKIIACLPAIIILLVSSVYYQYVLPRRKTA